ncbi:putative rrna-processing protein utp23 protein [Phaeoacremonium minimum UCRPA7]|uniref:U three protein 23 n=1 Tax=Phaeoacremonium minimum (strain UCR-PA7) TaxID=1286976 RepID=R8BDA4_PHAM7|nr:putative rrna-processing protein utp23 protein [Phaeoacremonium minimum UCRPA7]EON97284.1 putative rrna-processing protein utp23 protein [Phaeoacremonium minimum UCRPA7]
MKQYAIHFGFREPYQCLLDADMIRDASRFVMDLVPALERTLHGQVKPMVTQCTMRHLYARNKEPGMDKVIDHAKTFERRRCGHHPDQFPEPQSTMDCLRSVVGTESNKHRYVVATQDHDVRRMFRQVPGVPLIYIERSIMLLEPMAGATSRVAAKEEREKFRGGITKVGAGVKRKREEEEENQSSADDDNEGDRTTTEPEKKKKKKRSGPKQPNPLAVKKAKKKPAESQTGQKPKKAEIPAETQSSDAPAKRKRKRKHKSHETGDTQAEAQQEAVSAV